jgi:23S rRNA (pseudouridine1915-N3)-methyltransferase
MRIHLIATAKRTPSWVRQGYEEYVKRLPHQLAPMLTELAPRSGHSKGQDRARALHEEGERMLAAVPASARVVALEVSGQAWSTEQLATRLGRWLTEGRDVALLVGGPEGLAPQCRTRADEQWSLSPLTLPHALVRIVIAEQLYRAWSILQGHPYHRGD